MSERKRKKALTPEQRQVEIESAKLLGKHVSREKGALLLAVTLAACALPAVLGLRLWQEIPEVVSTGMIGMDGQDDSLPRWAVVFAVPGLMCVLDLICHLQLRWSQEKLTVPKPHIRLLGRWGFPILSLLCCSGLIFESAGRGLSLTFYTPCVLALALLLAGSHLWDCPRDARVSLGTLLPGGIGGDWDRIHRRTGLVWMVSGLLVAAGAMVLEVPLLTTALPAAVSLSFPLAARRG